MKSKAEHGLEVTYLDGTVEQVSCSHYWLWDGVLHTETLSLAGTFLSTGPSFPLVSIRKYEPKETRW